MILHAKRLNHGQSEIYIEINGTESKRRILATNELRNITARLCPKETFDTFYQALYVRVGSHATLTTADMDEIATELRLAGSKGTTASL
jgi:hypothetical protein